MKEEPSQDRGTRVNLYLLINNKVIKSMKDIDLDVAISLGRDFKNNYDYANFEVTNEEYKVGQTISVSSIL